MDLPGKGKYFVDELRAGWDWNRKDQDRRDRGRQYWERQLELGAFRVQCRNLKQQNLPGILESDPSKVS